MYKLNLADFTGRSKAVSFNCAVINQFKAGYLNYLNNSATSCNLLILKLTLSKHEQKSKVHGINNASNKVNSKKYIHA